MENSVNTSLFRELDDIEDENEELNIFVKEGETIKLPGKHIQTKYLHVPHSCKIIGSPETVLEITGGIFIGSFSESSPEWSTDNSKLEDFTAVNFCELEIHFNPNEASERNMESRASTQKEPEFEEENKAENASK